VSSKTSIPTKTSTIKGYYVKRVERKDIRDFIEEHHYSHNINGCSANFCYALYTAEGKMIGAMFYGRPAMHNQWKRFSDNQDKVIELRRLVCVDDTPKNTESFFIGTSLKMLAKDWRADGIVISYSDLQYNHSGIIYRASNFEYWGTKKGAKVIVHQGKLYHDKAIRTKYKGELKPFAKRLKEALEKGEAYYTDTKGKNTFVYFLDKKERRKRNKNGGQLNGV